MGASVSLSGCAALYGQEAKPFIARVSCPRWPARSRVLRRRQSLRTPCRRAPSPPADRWAAAPAGTDRPPRSPKSWTPMAERGGSWRARCCGRAWLWRTSAPGPWSSSAAAPSASPCRPPSATPSSARCAALPSHLCGEACGEISHAAVVGPGPGQLEVSRFDWRRRTGG